MGLSIKFGYDVGDLVSIDYQGRHYYGIVDSVKSVTTRSDVTITYRCRKFNGRYFKHIIIYRRK